MGVRMIAGTRRLKAIKCYYDNTVMRSYNFAYQYSPANISQLKSVTECGADGHCHTPTTFTWSNIGNISFYPFAINSVQLTTSATDRAIAIDMNADGVQDIVRIKNISGTPNNIEVYLSNKSATGLNFQSIPTNPAITDEDEEVFADFNGDGKQDILKYNKTTGSSSIYLNTYRIGASQLTFNKVGQSDSS